VTEQLPETALRPEPAPAPEGSLLRPPMPQAEVAPEQTVVPVPAAAPAPTEHASDALRVPDGYAVVEGAPSGEGRSVAIVVARFNGEITGALLHSALDALAEAGVARDAVTVMPVPGAFELPIAAMALAKTRKYACIVALGAVIRGDTPHFDYVAGEAASGLQLAALETGVPVAFGVLTTDTVEQARERVNKGADAVRTGLEMADVFSHLRGAAAASKG
jgi:6,7-dimethyl-8-ribityllumazine synthase